MKTKPVRLKWRLPALAMTGLLGVAMLTTAASAHNASPRAAAKGSSISIMSIAAEETQLTNHPEVPAAIKAAAMAFNKSGGINGHPGRCSRLQ